MASAEPVIELDAIGLCLAIHDNPQTVAWDNLWQHNFGFVGHKRIRDTDVVVWRGSYDAADWWRDMDCCTQIVTGIGRVHQGFYDGVFWRGADVDKVLGPRVVVTGHSLGAAEAAIHAGLRTSAGHPPEHVYLYGCPRPGMARLRDVVAPVPITSRANAGDPVPTVPWDIPLLDPYVAVRDAIPMNIPPHDGDTGLFRCHHCELYLAGVQALARPTVAAGATA